MRRSASGRSARRGADRCRGLRARSTALSARARPTARSPRRGGKIGWLASRISSLTVSAAGAALFVRCLHAHALRGESDKVRHGVVGGLGETLGDRDDPLLVPLGLLRAAGLSAPMDAFAAEGAARFLRGFPQLQFPGWG